MVHKVGVHTVGGDGHFTHRSQKDSDLWSGSTDRWTLARWTFAVVVTAWMVTVSPLLLMHAFLLAAASLLVGVVCALLIAHEIRHQTKGLSLREIKQLYSYYEVVLHAARAGLVLIGRDGTVVLCNDEARQLVHTPEVQPGQRVTDLWLDPDLAELMSSGRCCDGETVVEDGQILVVTQKRMVVDDENLGWATTLHDRTDLARMTGELDSLKAFNEMLRSRAHEADNRLHTVVMLVEMHHDDEAVGFATESMQQSQVLVDAVTGAVEDAPLAALLLGKIGQAEERGVSVRLARNLLIPSTGLAASDVSMVLGNLIDNAIDAAADSSGRWVEVDGWVDDPKQQIVFEVTDSGPGIPQELVSRAFQRGWSTKAPTPPPPRPGVERGIGLSLVSGTVRRLGGSIKVITQPSRFVVRLPLPQRAEMPQEADQ